MPTWWIGCSGFYYKDWKGLFYPEGLPQKKWLEYYCEHFNTLELNVTFYRFPKMSFLQNWYDKSPRTFSFSAKVPRLVTHYKRFNNCRREIREFYDALNRGLRDKLGCVLFQMHPQMTYSPEKLEQILDALDNDFRNVLEFRHASWWNNEVLDVVKKQAATFCSISYPGLPDDAMHTSPVMYYRFHGVPQLYRSPYSKRSLEKVAGEIKAYREVKNIYVYFNNDMEATSVTNARQLQQVVA